MVLALNCEDIPRETYIVQTVFDTRLSLLNIGPFTS